MTAPTTVAELTDERARVLNEIDDILNTAREAGRSVLEDDERTRHDGLVTRSQELDTAIAAAEVADGDAQRFQAQAARTVAYVAPAPNGPIADRPAARSLNELLWATDEEVAAGSFTKDMFHRSGAMNSVEQVVVRNSDGDAVQAPRITEFAPEHRGAVRSFQKAVADMALFGLMVDKHAKTSSEGFEVARGHKLFRDRWQSVCRAMDVDTAAEGGNWVPTGIGADLHQKVRAAGKVSALFTRIDLPTNPWKWPIEGADATAYRVAEPTSDTATKVTVSTPGTGAATFDAEIFGGRVLFSKSLEADSALAILPYVQRKLVQAFVDAEERAILDGDTDGTHQDSDTNSAGATDAAWAWDGLRKRALANSSASGGSALTVALLAARRADMDYYGLNPAEMAFIVPISSYYALVTDTNVITVDKFGPQATILNGQLGSLYGVPIIVSEHVRTNLNASGIHDAITTTKTYALAVNRNEWVMGQRTPLALETDDSLYRETYQRVVVGFMRQDFQNVNARGTSEDDTSIVYNVTP